MLTCFVKGAIAPIVWTPEDPGGRAEESVRTPKLGWAERTDADDCDPLVLERSGEIQILRPLGRVEHWVLDKAFEPLDRRAVDLAAS